MFSKIKITKNSKKLICPNMNKNKENYNFILIKR